MQSALKKKIKESVSAAYRRPGDVRRIRELGSRKLNIGSAWSSDVIGLSAPIFRSLCVGMEGLKTRLAGKITFSEVIRLYLKIQYMLRV